MSVFRLPGSLCSDLEAIMARFWWGGAVDTRKLHWKSWKHLCLPKADGGMGLKHLKLLNQAMVTKQGWRIFAQPEFSAVSNS